MSPHWASQPAGPEPGRRASRTLGLEGQWGFLSKEPGTAGHRDSTPKGHTQNLTHTL